MHYSNHSYQNIHRGSHHEPWAMRSEARRASWPWQSSQSLLAAAFWSSALRLKYMHCKAMLLQQKVCCMILHYTSSGLHRGPKPCDSAQTWYDYLRATRLRILHDAQTMLAAGGFNAAGIVTGAFGEGNFADGGDICSGLTLASVQNCGSGGGDDTGLTAAADVTSSVTGGSDNLIVQKSSSNRTTCLNGRFVGFSYAAGTYFNGLRLLHNDT